MQWTKMRRKPQISFQKLPGTQKTSLLKIKITDLSLAVKRRAVLHLPHLTLTCTRGNYIPPVQSGLGSYCLHCQQRLQWQPFQQLSVRSLVSCAHSGQNTTTKWQNPLPTTCLVWSVFQLLQFILLLKNIPATTSFSDNDLFSLYYCH